jgi:hypothetical protein
MPNKISSNPNASVTAFAGAITILVIWIAGVVGLSVPAEVGSAFTTVAAGAILWIGPRQSKQPTPEAAPA